MNFWVKIKDDLQKGVGEGIAMVKEGAFLVKQKAEEVTEEGKRRYQLYELKTTVHKEISELGGMVYELSAKVKNPMLNSKVKAIKARINNWSYKSKNLRGNRKEGLAVRLPGKNL